MIKAYSKPYLIISLCLLFPALAAFNTVKAQDVVIKNLRVYANNNSSALPVLVNDDNSREDFLNIEFEVANPTEPSLSIVFRFCDKNWNPYTNNSFLMNIGGDIAYNLPFVSLPVTNKETNYYYSGVFPDADGYVDFPFSGKWRFYITESNDTSIVYAEGKFYVVYNDYDISVKLKNETLEGEVYYPADLGKVYRIDTKFRLPENLFPFNVDQVEIVENRKIESPYVADKTSNTPVRFFEWDGTKNFNFMIRDIRPGKEYRQTDLRNVNIFQGPDVKAQRDGIETSRFFQNAKKDFNGGSVQVSPRADNAIYLNVEFKLRAPSEISNDVFIVGDFNNWVVSPEYKMNNSGGLHTLTLKLKRGAYDYQYVTADYDGDGGIYNENWLQLEGNTWETTNVYNVFLYYADPDKGGYDRIIGFTKIYSGKR
ncbi:MAG TPA: hypothetical protein VHO28_13730 [Ignavibacteriales bacterium]|nr:hypothetical protein [Ignavibacteriales bacterium]